MEITYTNIDNFSKKFSSQSRNILAKNAVTHVKLSKLLVDFEKENKLPEVFSHKIEIESKSISDQKRSGRCWIFALLNSIRIPMIKKYKLDSSFEFSQSYLFFYDKLEKSNFFLHNILQTKNLPYDNEYVRFLLKEPVSDGGQWCMLVDLVEKYGIIPQSCMKDSYHSKNSSELEDLLNDLLRQYALKIRELKKVDKKVITSMMEEIYKILVIFLGEPPKKIDWEYYTDKSKTNTKSKTQKNKKSSKGIQKKRKNKKSKYRSILNITPTDFYKQYVPYDIKSKICLINIPCKDRPFYKLYNLEMYGNMVNGRKTNYINVPLQTLKEATKKSIKKNDAVWFGNDVGKYMNTSIGILDNKTIDYSLLNIDIHTLSKGQKYQYLQSGISHAMLIKGFNQKKGEVDRWLVENSWGEDGTGTNGNFVMSDSWFDEYVFEIVVDKKHLDQKVLNVLKTKPIVLKPWDPLGNLA